MKQHWSLVMNCAKRLRRSGTVPVWITDDDLASVGFEALLACVRRFDSSRAQLHTYANHRVTGTMQDHVRDALLIRRRRNIEIPDIHQLSAFVDAQGEEFPFPDPAAERPDAKASQDDFWRRTLRGLTQTARGALELYYRSGLAMWEVGRELDLSESRVSQIIEAAIARLRKERRCEGLGT